MKNERWVFSFDAQSMAICFLSLLVGYYGAMAAFKVLVVLSNAA